MSRTDDPTPEPARPTLTRRRVALLAAAVAAVLVVVLVWALAQRGGPADDGAEPTAVASPTPSESASASPSPEPSSDPTPEPGAAPTATAPGEAPAVVDPGVPALPEPLAPRALTEEVPLGPEAVARVTAFQAVEGEPQGVGEIAGPALRFTVELENTGTQPITARDAVVNVTYGPEDVPATEVSGPGRVPFTGDIAPGSTASATFVFLVPVEERGDVQIALEYRFGAPIAVFEGSASDAPAG